MTLLAVQELSASHGSLQALFGVSLSLERGEAAAIVGANGAGKSTLLNCIAGRMPAPRDAILLEGEGIGGRPAHQIVRRGVAMAPEGRRLFGSLTVEENLKVGAHLARPGPWTLDRVFGLFPRLEERRRSPPTRLSGGEQQMVAIGRALMSNPELLLCDELSLGLAPSVVGLVFDALAHVRKAGMSIIIVEQNTVQAAAFADRVYCLRQGRIVLEAKGGELSPEALSAAYFGVA